MRPYREDDLPGLLNLYLLVFAKERTETEFRWKLLRSGLGFDTVWVADDHGRIVGQHAGIPMRLKLGSDTVPVVHAVEAMTHPDYRQQGMLTRLGGALYSRWREQGAALILGLPHAGWGTRAEALGYRGAFPLRWVSRPLRPLALLRDKLIRHAAATASSTRTERSLSVPASYLGGITVRLLSTANDEVNSLWQTLSAHYDCTVVRDAAWVQWRYLDAPGQVFTVLVAEQGGKLTGYVAYRAVNLDGRSIGRIADLFVAPGDKATSSALVRAATADLRARGADSTACLVAVGSPLHAVLRSRGFLLNRGEYRASFIPLAEDVDWAIIARPEGWLLTGGDYDVV